jgi:uncharacterized protein
MAALLWILAILLIVFGVIGTVLPGVPGPIIVFIGVVIGAWADGFSRVGAFTIALLAFMTAAAYAIDLLATALGARRFGASKRAIVGAALGMLIGLFFGLPGIIIGPFVGALLAELSAQRDLRQAGRAGVGAWIGVIVGVAIKLTLVFAMIGIFVVTLILR